MVRKSIKFNGGDSNLYGYVLGDPVNLVDLRGLYGLGDLWNDTKGTISEIPHTITSGDAVRFAWEHGDEYAWLSAGAVCITFTGCP